jgi:hypothetical protein
MARLLRDHGQDEEPKLPIIEQPAAAASAAMVVVSVVVAPPVTAIRQVIGVCETTV